MSGWQPSQYDPQQHQQRLNPYAPGPAAVPQPPLAPQPGYAPDYDRPVLQARSYSSPLSFTGATSRMIRAVSRTEDPGMRVTLAIVMYGIALPLAYAFIACWYLLVFGLFGIFAIPWRLHRRSQRRAQHLAEAQLAAFQRFSGGGAPPGYLPPNR